MLKPKISDIDVDRNELDRLVSAIVHDAELVGCSVGLVRVGRETYTWNGGVVDIETRVPVTEHSTFRLASTCKLFTAIGIMQLREAGMLDLDAPVNTYLHSYAWHNATGAAPATVRHLMTHTSGVGEFLEWKDLFKPYAGLGIKQREDRTHQLADNYQAGITPAIAPGVKWAYSNHAVAALGQIIEDVSGEPFADYMRQHLFDPIGMVHTDFRFSDRVATPASGYRKVRGAYRKVGYVECAVPPAGSAWSTVTDMSRFLTFLLEGTRGNTTGILAPETLVEMFESQWAFDPRLPQQGLIFLLDEIHGHKAVWHDGAYPGYATSMIMVPDHDIGVIVFNNSSSGAAHTVAEAVLGQLLEPAAVPGDTSRPSLQPNTEVWPSLVGVYKPSRGFKVNVRYLGFCGGELTIEARNGQLIAQGLPWGGLKRPVVLRQSNPTDPYLHEGAGTRHKTGLPFRLRLAFTPSADGSGMTMTALDLLTYNFTRRSPWRSLRRVALLTSLAGFAVLMTAFLL